MSHDDAPQLSGQGVFIGIALPVVLGTLVAMVYGSGWTGPEGLEGLSASAWWMFSVLLVGVSTNLMIGIVMAYHGAVIGAAEDPAAQAPAWGLVVGFLCGASMGAVMGFSAGILCGQILGATLYGLYFGPIAGILSWEAAYWFPKVMASRQAPA